VGQAVLQIRQISMSFVVTSLWVFSSVPTKASRQEKYFSYYDSICHGRKIGGNFKGSVVMMHATIMKV